MSNYNPLISNGTCYFSANQSSDPSFIPCGNNALGRITCCGVGDNCLGNRACFNGAFGLTYLAGCTDPEYKHESCPDKGVLDDSPWTGLVYCNGTSNQWMACEERNKPAALRKGDICFCPRETGSRMVVFSAPSTLINIASLPPKTGSSVRFENGFVPTQVPGQTTVTLIPPTGTGSANNSPQETNPANTQGDPPSNGNGGAGSLSTGAKAGIGAGVGAVALLALATIVFFFMRHRKQTTAIPNEKHADNGIFAPSAVRHGEDDDDHFASGFGAKTVGPNNHHSVACSTHGTLGMMTAIATPDTLAVSELDSHAARPWSMRSELQGSANAAGGWELQQKHPQNAQPVTPLTPEHPQSASHYPGFRAYRPPGDPHTVAIAPVSPVPGSVLAGCGVSMHHQQGATEQQQPSRSGALNLVHELP